MTESQLAAEAIVSDEEFYQREFTQRPIEVVCPEKGVNTPWMPSIARRLWLHGYSDQEIFDLIREATRSVKHRTISDGEITRAIALVIGTGVDSLRVIGRGE